MSEELRNKAKSLRDVIDEFTHTRKWVLDFYEGDCVLSDQDKKEWVRVEDAEAWHKDAEKDKVEAIKTACEAQEKASTKLVSGLIKEHKQELDLVRQEAERAIRKAQEERYENATMEADLNGYSRGKADAQEEIEELEARLNRIREIRKRILEIYPPVLEEELDEVLGRETESSNFVEVSKGMYTTREKPSRPIIKIEKETEQT